MDNETDGEAWERLGAIRMPENMATEIFGNNAKYADNTTCVITENPDNPDFPFDVQFDSSKIPTKPKRNTGTLVGIGMPGEQFINITPTTNQNYMYIAPYNGYLCCFCGAITGLTAYVSLHTKNDKISRKLYTVCQGSAGLSAFVLARKGDEITINYRNATLIDCRFVLAQGEI